MNCWHCNTELIWGGDHDIDDVEDMYVDPPDDETTPYGKVPQEAEKGTLPSPYGKPYGLVYRI